MKKTKKTVITFLVIFLVYWLFSGLHLLPSLRGIFVPKPVVIDETPILIKEIKSIGQLITYSALDEVVVDSIVVSNTAAFVNTLNKLSPLPVLPSADKQLVLIGRGKILAGTNLSLLSDSSISFRNDTLEIFLPKAQILDAIVNPSDFETFVEKGDWTPDEVTQVQLKARKKMIDHALQQNILDKANTKAKTVMENFLHNMGYKEVLVFN